MGTGPLGLFPSSCGLGVFKIKIGMVVWVVCVLAMLMLSRISIWSSSSMDLGGACVTVLKAADRPARTILALYFARVKLIHCRKYLRAIAILVLERDMLSCRSSSISMPVSLLIKSSALLPKRPVDSTANGRRIARVLSPRARL